MLLSSIIDNPLSSLDYCERRVNKGSPSNFTEKYLPSDKSNPFVSSEFLLSVLRTTPERISVYGEVPEFILNFRSEGEFLVHPDLSLFYTNYHFQTTDLRVSPTSSSRTARILSYPYYIKLCYPHRIGRVTRELDDRHIRSSIDVTNIFKNLSENQSMSEKFAYLPECGGMLFCSNKDKIGFVIRDIKPEGKNIHKVEFVLPSFSLFSKDRDNPSDDFLLNQIICANNSDSCSYLLNHLCFPLIDIFFGCVMLGGIVPELHSQNVLLGFDKFYNIQSIIIRDMESHDKDLTLMKSVNKLCMLDSCPFKCIDDSQFNYTIKHSFMFDHKLGEYLLLELINVLSDKFSPKHHYLCNAVKEYVLYSYGNFINATNFFPEDGKWYKFKDITVDRTKTERPYISMDNPLFR